MLECLCEWVWVWPADLQAVLMNSLHPVGEDQTVSEDTLSEVSLERIQLGLGATAILQWSRG